MWTGLALHTWTLDSTPLAEVLRAARSTGWDAIELRRVDFRRAAEAGQSAPQVLDLVRASGLPVACVGGERGWMFATGPERRRLLDAMAESCRWAHDLGCGTVMSPADPGTGDRARAIDSLREMGDIAAKHAVRVAIEFNCLAEQFNSLERMRDVLGAAGHPHCGLLFDTYHFDRSGGKPEAVEGVSRAELVYVQFSDVPRAGSAPGQMLDRLPPGRGRVPFADIFRRLSGRYDGYLSYEAPNPELWKLPPDRAAREALDATRAVLP
jgi:sugar phosphate isomerase/epimerase